MAWRNTFTLQGAYPPSSLLQHTRQTLELCVRAVIVYIASDKDRWHNGGPYRTQHAREHHRTHAGSAGKGGLLSVISVESHILAARFLEVEQESADEDVGEAVCPRDQREPKVNSMHGSGWWQAGAADEKITYGMVNWAVVVPL